MTCPSVVVTDISMDSASVLWSCSTAVIVSKFIVEAVLEHDGSSMESIDSKSQPVGVWHVDGSKKSFRLPAGSLQNGFGPYCIKVTAVAGPSMKSTGVSTAFFTKDELLGAVSALSFASHGCRDGMESSGVEIDLEWHPPEGESCAIQDYRVSLHPAKGDSRSFTVHKCMARISLLESDFDAKIAQPVTVEVSARSFTGAIGKISSVQIPIEVLHGDGVRPASLGSRDEPLAEPPLANETPKVASPWLGIGWEKSFVAQARAPFEPTGPDMLFVRQGDSIQVLELHDSGWAYCKNLSTHPEDMEPRLDSAGWVPTWVVKKSARGTSKNKVKSAHSKTSSTRV